MQHSDAPTTSSKDNKIHTEKYKAHKEELLRKTFSIISGLLVATCDDTNTFKIHTGYITEMRLGLIQAISSIVCLLPPPATTNNNANSHLSNAFIYSPRLSMSGMDNNDPNSHNARRDSLVTEEEAFTLLSPSSVTGREHLFSFGSHDADNTTMFPTYETLHSTSTTTVLQHGSSIMSSLSNGDDNGVEQRKILKIIAHTIDTDLFSLLLSSSPLTNSNTNRLDNSRNIDVVCATLKLFIILAQENRIFVRKYLSSVSDGDGWDMLQSLVTFSGCPIIYIYLFALLFKLPIRDMTISNAAVDLSKLNDMFGTCLEVTNVDNEDGIKIFELICTLLKHNIDCLSNDAGSTPEEIQRRTQMNTYVISFLANKSVESNAFGTLLRTSVYISAIVSALFAVNKHGDDVHNGVLYENESINILEDHIKLIVSEDKDEEEVELNYQTYIYDNIGVPVVECHTDGTISSAQNILTIKINSEGGLEYSDGVWAWCVTDIPHGVLVGNFVGAVADQLMSLLATIMQSALVTYNGKVCMIYKYTAILYVLASNALCYDIHACSLKSKREGRLFYLYLILILPMRLLVKLYCIRHCVHCYSYLPWKPVWMM